MSPDRGDDSDEVGPGPHQRGAVLRRDAADGDAGDFHDLAPPLQDFRSRLVEPRLGVGGVEGAEGDVVGTLFACHHGEMPAVVAGDADDGVLADDAAGLGVGGVLLADMDAVAAGFGGDVGAVVDEEGDAALLGDGPQAVAGPADEVGLRRLVGVARRLQPHLHAGDVAGVEGFGQLRREDVEVQLGRGDEVEAAGGGIGHREGTGVVKRKRPSPNKSGKAAALASAKKLTLRSCRCAPACPRGPGLRRAGAGSCCGR